MEQPRMASLTEMKITNDVSNEPIQSMTCRMLVSIKNIKTLGLFDMIEYKYIKYIIHNDIEKINIWIVTKQVTEEQKNTTFTFNLQYDELNVKSFKVSRPYANASKYQVAVKHLVSIGKEEEETTDEEEE